MQTAPRERRISRKTTGFGQKVVLYGPGGVGKSSLVASLEDIGKHVLVVDIEDSCRFLDVSRLDPAPANWEETRGALQDMQLLEPFDVVALESGTRAEEFAAEWTLKNVPHEKGHYVSSVEGYGWGKGYTHVFETFLALLGDLDAIARAGKHVVVTCHDVTEKVPNPAGEDWLQYQPRLQSPPKMGKIRERVKEWCDHLLYIGFDIFVNSEGKASGSGTRTIYPMELPTHWAKSRKLAEEIPYPKGDTAVWTQLFTEED